MVLLAVNRIQKIIIGPFLCSRVVRLPGASDRIFTCTCICFLLSRVRFEYHSINSHQEISWNTNWIITYLSLHFLIQGSGRFSVLANIRMQYSTNTLVSANTSYNVENCSCPVGYTGLSCERCSVGYTRSPPYGSAYSACVPCKCNNHAATCDPVNGVCNNCQHSTTGTLMIFITITFLKPFDFA